MVVEFWLCVCVYMRACVRVYNCACVLTSVCACLDVITHCEVIPSVSQRNIYRTCAPVVTYVGTIVTSQSVWYRQALPFRMCVSGNASPMTEGCTPWGQSQCKSLGTAHVGTCQTWRQPYLCSWNNDMHICKHITKLHDAWQCLCIHIAHTKSIELASVWWLEFVYAGVYVVINLHTDSGP